MRLSGDAAVDVEISSGGKGRYRLSEPFPQGRSGVFSLSSQQFAALVERLRPFQGQSVPLTEESVKELLEYSCPQGVPKVTDLGGFWLHWIGPKYDHHYAADFGCDHERNRARNEELRAILESLPVPLH